MNNDDDIKAFIKKQHFKTNSTVIPKIQKKFPDLTKKQIKAILDETVIRDMRKPTLKKALNKYFNKTFSNHSGSWMMDIFVNENDENSNKSYYLIFVNVNTKYLVAIELEDRSATSVSDALKKFLKTNKAVTIISDSEKAFSSDELIRFLIHKGIDLYTVSAGDQHHTGLNIVDRVIKTIRDLKGENGVISKTEMNHLVKQYNKTVNSSTGFAPKEMTEKDEKLYIFEKIRQQSDIHNTPGYTLKTGDLVRVIEPKKTLKKVRYNVSKVHYKITGQNGYNYILMAEDGSTKTKTRAFLIDSPGNTPLAKTVPGTSRGEIKEILEYIPKKDKYRVVFSVPDGEDVIDTITARSLRENNPTSMSVIEREFFRRRNN